VLTVHSEHSKVKYLLLLLLLLLTFTLLAVEFSAPVRHGYFKIEIDGVIQSENYSTYRKATFAHTQAVMANPSKVIKLIPAWYEDIKVTGIIVDSNQVVLSWMAPTQNTDNLPLTDLAGFKVYYGVSEDSMTTVVNASGSSITIKDLDPNTYYFAVVAVNELDVEGELSNIVSKTIN